MNLRFERAHDPIYFFSEVAPCSLNIPLGKSRLRNPAFPKIPRGIYPLCVMYQRAHFMVMYT
jgi:hypothetical protein